MIYIIHLFSVLILYILFGRNKQTEKIFTSTSFLYVMFVYGQRWMTGTDFPYYLEFYIKDFTRSEWGYFGLQTLFRESGFYFGLLIFFILLITQFNFYRFFLKFDQNTFMIFLFLISEIFFAQMSQLRQYVAISFFINAFYFSYDQKYGKSIINMLLAYSFHSTALYFIPFLFLKLPLNKKFTLFVFSTGLVLPFVDIRNILKIPIFQSYSGYLGSQFDLPLGFGHVIKYYTVLFIFLFIAYNIKKLADFNYTRMIINAVMFYIVIYGMSFHFAPLFRIATYFQTFEIVFLAYASTKLKNIPEFETKSIIAFLFIGIFTFSGLADSYSVSDYQIRFLRFHENHSIEQLSQ